MSPKKSTSQSSSTSQCSEIPSASRRTPGPRDSSSRVLPLSRKASSPSVLVYAQSQMTTPPVEPPELHANPKDSDRNSLLLSSHSHREHSPSPNSPHQLSLTINGTTTNLNSERQSRKRSKTIPVFRIRSYKRSRISIGQRSVVSPPIDTHSISNLDIQQNPNNNSNNKIIIQNPYCTTEDKREPSSSHTDYSSSSRTEEPVTLATRKAHVIENNFDNLMNELQASFNITRTVINNHRNFIESKLNQMTQQCEKLNINLNDS